MDARVQTKIIFLFAIGVLELLTGCNRPAWEERSSRRRESVHRHICRYTDYDAAGRERLDFTMNRIRKARCYHEEHLETTANLARREMESDERRWCEDQPKRGAFAHRQWHGKPDTIPGTWAKMVY